MPAAGLLRRERPPARTCSDCRALAQPALCHMPLLCADLVPCYEVGLLLIAFAFCFTDHCKGDLG